MTVGRRVLASAGLVLGDLTALVALRPDPGALAGDVAAPHAWVAEVSADGAAITLAGAGLWCVAVWLGLGLLAATATQLPGSLGRVARSVSRALLPAAIYRIVAGAAGLGVLLAPVAAGAEGRATASVSPAGGQPVLITPAIPAPTWPSDRPRSTPTLPTPRWPTSPAPTSSAPTDRPTKPTARSAPAKARPAHRAGPARTSTAGPGVVVRSGDSLWRIAADHLGQQATASQIGAAWPRWYTANHTAIGADPGLIRPGQHLQAPASTQARQ